MAAMISFLFITLLSVYGTYGAPHQPESSRIIGGEDAVQGQFPGIVSLRETSAPDLHSCGGGIVASDVIITAAHCVPNLKPEDLEIVAGSILISEGGVRVPVKKILTHEHYGNRQNDISLLLLKTPLNFTDDIQPLKLADNNTVSAGDTVAALGWGATAVGQSNSISSLLTSQWPKSAVKPRDLTPDHLQWVSGKIRSNKDCTDEVGVDIIDGQICFGGVDGEGLCYGDSGSPLIYNGDTTVGIVSYGIPCAVGYPDVFTRVSAYVDWINENSQKLRQEP